LTKVRTISLVGTNITDAGVEAMEKAIPGLKVVR
jgi:hypothetical protein